MKREIVEEAEVVIEKPTISFEPFQRLMDVYNYGSKEEVKEAIRERELTKKVLKTVGLTDEDIAEIKGE